MNRRVAISVALLLPLPALAQEVRDFCPDRPGLGTAACTIDRGHAAVELGVVDWTSHRQSGVRTTALLVSDLLVRYGLSDHLEVQLGWTAFGQVSTRAVGASEGSRESGSGDVLIALRRNVRNPDGSGLAIAVMPFATLPTGGTAIGAGDWAAGILLPVNTELPAGFQLGFTGIFEAAVDGDRVGRHPAYGAVVGLDVPLSASLETTLELAARRNRDPSSAATESLAELSFAWSPRASLQLDAGANVGLSRSTPDLQLYVGVARRF